MRSELNDQLLLLKDYRYECRDCGTVTMLSKAGGNLNPCVKGCPAHRWKLTSPDGQRPLSVAPFDG